MKIFVISLPRSIGRRKHVERELARQGLEFEWVDGVDAAALPREELHAAVEPGQLRNWHEELRPGAIGCALAHRKAYQRMVEQHVEVAVILEDDVILAPSFAQSLPILEATLRDDEVILFYTQSNEPPHAVRKGSVPLPGGHALLEIDRFTYFGGAIGYLIRRSAALALLEFQRPVRTGADNWAEFHARTKIHSFRITIPFLVTPAGYTSEIGYEPGKLSRARRLAQAVERNVAPVGGLIRLLRRRMAASRASCLVDRCG